MNSPLPPSLDLVSSAPGARFAAASRRTLPADSAGRRPRRALLGLAAATMLLAACSPGPEPAAEVEDRDFTGRWRAVLASPGGELPFTLEIEPDGEGLAAVAVHGAGRDPLGPVTVDGEQVTISADWYDSRIEAGIGDGGDSLSGRWVKVVPDGTSELPFTAVRGDGERFVEEPGIERGDADALASVDGVWGAQFVDDSGSSPARAELRQQGERVSGTFLTPTGDYRFLEGSFRDGLLRLSTFDGAHAFLFHARVRNDGTLEGDFWSRDSYHATWTAERTESEAPLPDGWTLAGLRNDEGRFGFSFPNLEGDEVSLSDPRFAGKVVVADIFGTWCPNCNDQAPVLAEWDRRWRERGLEVVGLAYEFSGDPERDRRQLERYAERHGIEFPLLLAGTSDKADAAATLPDLTAVIAYPTTVFIGRDGRVRRIYSGFSGPGTGVHYERLVAEHEALIEELLAEPATES